MTFTIANHGDLLEKEASEFITTKFPYYERVWSLYIGNRGNATKANLPNYPYEGKRSHFAENSYTALESCYIIKTILAGGTLKQSINNFELYVQFNISFISFFAHIGRILDMMKKNSNLLKCKEDEFQDEIRKFYEGRNIVLHGKKVPFEIDENGHLKMPALQLDMVSGTGWEDKHSFWAKLITLPTQFVDEASERLFNDLLLIIDNQYARFYNNLQQELKSLGTELLFERITSMSPYPLDASGTTRVGVYNIKEHFPSTPASSSFQRLPPKAPPK